MSVSTAVPLEDVQGQVDARGIPIDEVGIADLRYPIHVAGRDGVTQASVATITATVYLAADARGTHMSRFVEALSESPITLNHHKCVKLGEDLRERLGSSRAQLSFGFAYFIERRGPISGLQSLIDVDARLDISAADDTEVRLTARVPITSLCPCSKEISDYGAHNQRGSVEIEAVARTGEAIWFEDLIDTAEGAASSPIYSLLKRVDERHVTMQAYDNPAFVEDIARDVVVALESDSRIGDYAVRVTNQESIHNHNAVATIRRRSAT